MKTILLVLTNNIGGLHSFRKEVMKALIDADYEVFISVPDDDERAGYFEEIGCQVVKTKFNRRGMNPFHDFKLMLKYYKLIKELTPKAVLSYTIKPNVYGGIACRLTNTPLIANVTGLGDAIENGGWLQKLTITLYKTGIGKAYQVFFQNQTNRDKCISYGIADETSIVLPGSGVNLKHHVYQDYPEDGVITFLLISRLLKDKGIEEYFEMAEFIKQKYPQTEFQILGWVEGDFQQRLNDLVSKDVINYIGTTTDVRPYLARVHCTVLPSYHEGMSNVNLESSANGRPVITTDVPGCRETIDDGKTGFLVRPKSTKDLIGGVEKFLGLSYVQKRQMGINARKKVEREFDRKIVVEAYLNAVNSLSESS